MNKIRNKEVKKLFRKSRKVVLPRIEFIYEESKDNEELVQDMYNRIFEIAKQNTLAMKRQKSNL